jgi:hypothetical protein
VRYRIALLAALLVGVAIVLPAAAQASSVTGVSTPTLSSTAGGVTHVRYAVTFTATTMFGGSGTFIRIDAPAGTTLPTLAQIHDLTTGVTVSRSGAHPSGNATLQINLCCTDAINANDMVTVTLDDVTNAPTGGPYSLNVSTSADTTPVASPNYSLTTPEQVTNVSGMSVSSAAAEVPHVTYSFGFNASTTTGELVSPGTIKIDAPAGTVLPGVAQLHDDTTGASFSRSGTRSNSNATLTVSLCCTDTINPGDRVSVTLVDVTNAAAGGHTFDVSTSSNPTPVTSGSYTLSAPEQVTGVTGVSLSSAAGGIKHVRYSFGFTASGTTGALVAPGTITIAAPAGTVLPGVAQLRDNTTGASFSRSGTLSNSNATLTVSLCCTDTINPGDSVTVTLDDVTNPATGGPYTLGVSTSSNPGAVTGAGYSLTAPQSLTGLTSITVTTDTHGVVSDSLSFRTSTPTGGLVPSGTITIAAPAGTVLPSVGQFHDDTTNTGGSRSGTLSNSNATLTFSLCCSDAIAAGDAVTVTLAGVTNPAGAPGPFQVSTSSDTLAAQTAPAPVIGQKATAAPEKGVVLFKAPGKKGFVVLTAATSVPVGSTLDTTHGQVGLTFATNATGGTQRGSFSEGQFQVLQTRKNPLTTLSMTGGSLNSCKVKLPKGGAPKAAAGGGALRAAAKKHRRTLFSSVHGHFQTRGRNSTATVRGTKWRVTDTCTGTKTTVTQGSVLVRDLTLNRTRLVAAGHSYLARAPLRKKKRH